MGTRSEKNGSDASKKPLGPMPDPGLNGPGELKGWYCERCGEGMDLLDEKCVGCGLVRPAHLAPWVEEERKRRAV